jgi:hypothetical protein
MKRYFFLFILFFILLLMVPPGIATAEIYKYTDDSGAVAFTDDFSKIPEAQRPNVEIKKPVAPASSSMPTPPPRNALLEWIAQPLSKYIIGFIALALFMLFIQSRAEGFFLRMAVKALFIGFLGAAIYTTMVSRGVVKPQDLSVPALTETVKSALPDPGAITKVKKQLEQVKERQEQDEARLQSLDDFQPGK